MQRVMDEYLDVAGEDALAELRERAELENKELRVLDESPDGARELLLRPRCGGEPDRFSEVRIASAGNVDAGKSTLLAVLTHSMLDDGRGVARQRLLRHRHETDSGRTSSVGRNIIGFDERGRVVNAPVRGRLDWVDTCAAASKIVMVIDLAGHQEYYKTTATGLTGQAPDAVMLVVAGEDGVAAGMCKEHLGLALTLGVPVFMVVTKIDTCPEARLRENLKHARRLFRQPGVRLTLDPVDTDDDVRMAARGMAEPKPTSCPLFLVSSVTGEGVDRLRGFLDLLRPRRVYDPSGMPLVRVDQTYKVDGVGGIASGLVHEGAVSSGDHLLLGPDSLGRFRPVVIRSIERHRVSVGRVQAGDMATFALRRVAREDIHRGMVLAHPARNPRACWAFDARVTVLRHPTTIGLGSQMMLHGDSLQQTVGLDRFLDEGADYMRLADRRLVRLRFRKQPEFMREGDSFMLREDRARVVGVVVATDPDAPATDKTRRSKRKESRSARRARKLAAAGHRPPPK